MIFTSKEQLATYIRRSKKIGCTHIKFKCVDRKSTSVITTWKDAYSVIRGLQSETGNQHIEINAWDGLKWYTDMPEETQQAVRTAAQIAWNESYSA